MKTISFVYQGKELPKDLENLKGNVLVQIFDNNKNRKLVNDLISKLEEKLDKPIIVKSVVPLSLCGGIYTDEISVIVSFFTKTRLAIRKLSDVESFKKTIYSMLEEDTKGFLILADKYANLDELSSDLESFRDYYFFGALGSKTTLDSDDNLDNDIKIISFSGELEIHSFNFTEYTGIGNWRKITKANKGRVYEIDNVNIMDYYRRIFPHQEEISLKMLDFFPLVNKRLGSELSYVPTHIYQDGSMEFPINFKIGDEVRITYLDIYTIKERFLESLNKLNDYNCEALLSFSSIHKYGYRRAVHMEEVKNLNDHIVPINGALDEIEIISNNGEAKFVSGASVVVSLAENESRLNLKIDENKIKPIVNDDERVMFDLINTLSSDLEETHNYFKNHLLDKLDETIEEKNYDEATDLYNQVQLLEDIKDRQYDFNITTCKLVNESFLRNYYGNTYMNNCKRQMIEVVKQIIDNKAKIYYLYDGLVIASRLNRDAHKALIKQIAKQVFKYGFNYKNDLIDFGTVYGTCYKGHKHPFSNSKITLADAIQKGFEYEEYGHTSNSIYLQKEGFDQFALITKAYKENLFKAFYQGIYDTKEKKITKYEALVRIVDEGVIYSPARFLECAYRFGYGRIITKSMILQVATKIKETGYNISLNIRLEDLDDDDLCAYFLDVTTRLDVVDKLIIEILEDGDILKVPSYLERINYLRSYGVQISIDDFGTGYSNLSYFNLDCFDYIKIAGDLVKLIDKDTTKMLIETITKMAHLSNFKVVAEYCENRESAKVLENLGVDYIQGYYFSKPSEALGV